MSIGTSHDDVGVNTTQNNVMPCSYKDSIGTTYERVTSLYDAECHRDACQLRRCLASGIHESVITENHIVAVACVDNISRGPKIDQLIGIEGSTNNVYLSDQFTIFTTNDDIASCTRGNVVTATVVFIDAVKSIYIGWI